MSVVEPNVPAPARVTSLPVAPEIRKAEVLSCTPVLAVSVTGVDGKIFRLFAGWVAVTV